MSRWPRAHLAVALLAALTLVVIATSTRTARPGAHRVAHYVSARGRAIRYVRAGRGPTVVLLHGYGESLIAWRAVFDILASGADVIALDLPGFGLSAKPAGPYLADSVAADVLSALDMLGVRQASVVGHSMGGAVAVAMALQAPQRMRALVLVDPAVVGPPTGVPDSAQRSQDSAARRAIAEYEALRTRFSAPHDPQWLTEDDSALAYSPSADPAYRGFLASVLRDFDFHSLTGERAARLTLPVLVLWGEFDPVISIDSGRAAAARLPGARFEVIARSWHRPHVERPAETAALVRQFLGERHNEVPGRP